MIWSSFPSNNSLDVTTKVFFWMWLTFKSVDYRPCCGWASSNQLKALREHRPRKIPGKGILPPDCLWTQAAAASSPLGLQSAFCDSGLASLHKHMSQFLKVNPSIYWFSFSGKSRLVHTCPPPSKQKKNPQLVCTKTPLVWSLRQEQGCCRVCRVIMHMHRVLDLTHLLFSDPGGWPNTASQESRCF